MLFVVCCVVMVNLYVFLLLNDVVMLLFGFLFGLCLVGILVMFGMLFNELYL